jgi:translation initiation factor IF-2
MVEDKKDNKVTSNNSSKDITIPAKKTLSLSGVSGVDINKVLEKKEKKVRGTTIEVKNSAKAKDPLPQDAKKDSKISDLHKDEIDQISKKSKLTDDEISKRLKVLEEAEKNNTPSDVSGAQDIGLGSFRVVKRKEEIAAETIPVSNTPVDTNASINSSEVFNNEKNVTAKSSKIFIEEDDENKKAKKKLATEEDKKKITNWKNVNVADIEEDDEDDDFEEEEEEVEEEQQKQQKHVFSARRKNKRRDANIPKVKILREVELSKPLSVIELALKITEKVKTLIKALDKMGIKARENTILDLETAEILSTELGHKVKIIDLAAIEKEFLVFNDKPEDLVARPPVVTIMGHVDHGKTTLLDTIRKTNVVAKESGGITQHIGAYQVKTPSGQLITFLDTPGHEAFSQIRSRGSKVTDIVVLVVAADDGVKQQTVEAINHALLAGVPIILAINKIDKPEKNPQRVKTELLQHNIVVEELGGDVLVVEISAKNNIGIDKLLETILLQAEVLDLKTNQKTLGKGSIVEVKVEKGFGTLATVLVDRGKLRLGDVFVCGTAMGRIKVMINDKGERLKEALPATPVEISGFDGLVSAGDDFIVVPSESKALELINYRLNKDKIAKATSNSRNLDYLLSDNIENIKTLPLIVKTDTQGSLEAIVSSLAKIKHKDLEIKIIHSGVGEINESDIMLTKTAKGIIVGFNSRANSKARDIAKKEDVEIRYHSIIYNLIDDIKMILSGLLDPTIVENIIGYAEVRAVFNITKVGQVAGCYVREGILKRSAYVRVLRDNVVIHSGSLSQLKRMKDDVKEVGSKFECGVSVENYTDIKEGDLIECFEKNEVREKVE